MINYPIRKKILSENDTVQFAEYFASNLNGNEIISINGTLGAGKTFFVKAMAAYFEINNSSSPSFAIVNEYKGNKKIYHFDFYRIKKENELYDIGIEEYLMDSEAIKIIEWADLFPEVLPKRRININITLNEDFTRDFLIEKYE